MKIETLLIMNAVLVMVIQPVFAIDSQVQSDDLKCIKRAYEIETSKNQRDALLELEGDCIYSPKVSLEVRCLVWSYDIGIRYDNV